MVQPKYSPEEALKRIKLMMEYDSSKTLTENKETISEQYTPGYLGTATGIGAVAGAGIAAGGASALGSAAAGAALGTAAFPVVGTAIGAVVGLGLGALTQWGVNKDSNSEGFKKLMGVCKAPGADKLVKKLSNGDIRSIAYAIKDSKGNWNDDEDTIAAELGKIPTIADLCAVDKKVPGGLFEFLDGVTDSPDEWERFTRPIEGMIEDTQVVLTPEEQKKAGLDKVVTGSGKSRANTGGYNGGGYLPCTGTYKYKCKSNAIAKVQGCLGLVADGKFGPKTKAALAEKGYSTFVDSDVDKICNKQPQKPKEDIVQVDADITTDLLDSN
jgi:hypothetical protein